MSQSHETLRIRKGDSRDSPVKPAQKKWQRFKSQAARPASRGPGLERVDERSIAREQKNQR